VPVDTAKERAMDRIVNGYPLADVDRAETLVKDLGGRAGLPYIVLESSDRQGMFQIMNGDHKVGPIGTLGEIRKMAQFALDVIDEAIMEPHEDGEPSF
jgi:hypothetical protein